MSPFDTICAPITAPGGAVAIIRVSGPRTWEIARPLFSAFPEQPESHRAYYGRFSNGDDGLVLFFSKGRSYTGEQSVELNVHGSSASVAGILADLEAGGCRLARPGEFTERAFLSGRLDLSQAESVNDTVNAMTSRQLSLANRHREGGMRTAVSQMVEGLTKVVVAIEASVDFSEEIGDFDPAFAEPIFAKISAQLELLIRNAADGRFIREGIRIAIIGPPNAGKSSLLNRLLGIERSIVTPVAGTTRDYVEESCVLAGLACVLIDTAGLRSDSGNAVEDIGIQRARAIAAEADLIWFVFDGSVGLTETDRAELVKFGKPVTLIANKCDLEPSGDGLPISTYTGEGLGALTSTLAERLPDLSGLIPNRRHEGHLRSAEVSVRLAQEGMNFGHPPDLLVTHLKHAIAELGQITGETADRDLLDRIFRDFCIGK